jgi:SAM-dependent methyltransferase
MPPARRLRFQLALDTLERELDVAGDLLDAGCGEGLFANEVAARFPRWKVIGADHDERLLATARALANGLPNASFIRADLTEDLGRERFDAVVALECLEEIQDDEAAVTNMARALRRGGLFVGHVPERDWKPVLRDSDPIWRYEVRHGYGVDELVDVLDRAGLDVRRIEPTTHGIVRLATEIRDRIKHSSLKIRMLAYPWMLAAVRLERLGLRWGYPRGLFVEAKRR